MGFLAPAFLAGMAAIGLPLWLHLLEQHRLDPVRFPSLQLFEKRTQSSVRQKRLKYKLLLALRCLLLLLLALAFAQPFLRQTIDAAAAQRHVVIAVDNSFSMRVGGALDTAKRQALSAVDALRPGDSAQVLGLSTSASLLTQPTQDRAELKAAISAISQGDGRSSYAELARALKAIGSGVRLPLKVELFTDLQRSSMPATFSEAALPQNASLELHPAREATGGNFTVESVAAPTAITDPKRVRLTAVIRGFATPAANKTATLSINGKDVQSKPVSIPAAGRAGVEFSGFDAPYGWNRCEVRVNGDDALSADDAFRFAMERADPRPVLLVHEPGKTRPATYLRAALESSGDGFFSLQPLSLDQAGSIDPSRYAAVILNDLISVPAALEAALKKYVEGGGGVLVATGAMSAGKGVVPLTGAKVVESRYASRSAERFFSASQLDLSHPSVAKANKWEGVRFYQALKIDAGKAAVVARLNDGTPLLLDERSGAGRIMTMASALDNVSNDFPLHTAFVPFVEQTIRYLARVESRSATQTVDSSIELRPAGVTSPEALEVLDPKGGRALDLKASTTAQTFQVTGEGFYEIQRRSGRRELVAVNADRAESNLERMPPDSVEVWKRTGEETVTGPQSEAAQSKPVSYWWYVVLLLLVSVLAESFLASRHLEPERA